MKKMMKKFAFGFALIMLFIGALFFNHGNMNIVHAEGIYCNDITFNQILDSSFIGGTLEEGNYYLNEDINLEDYITISSNVNICLNGHLLIMNEYNINVDENVQLSIYDCNGEIGYLKNNNLLKNNEEGSIEITGGAITGATNTAIYSNGTLNIYNVNFVNNSTATSGGALYIKGGAATIKDCLFSNNVATEYGGAIYSLYVSDNISININNCIFSNNTALSGGALYIKGGTATIKDCLFSNNVATEYGGAIYSLYVSDNISININNCIFSNNTALSGGAIYTATLNTEYEGIIINLKHCTFNNNTATSGDGGAIYNSGTLNINQNSFDSSEKCTFINNSGATNGGAIYNKGIANIYNSSFTNNSATSGGAIYNSSDLLLQNCDAKNNTASSKGGAIYFSSFVTLIGTTITDNYAGNCGGGIYSPGFVCLAKGTKITMSNGTTKSIEDIKEGDLVRTFDHENGKLSYEKVCYVFESNNKSNSFTLHFSNNTIDVVGEHDFLEKTSRKYVTISETNVNEFVGKYFYNANTASWEKLVNYTINHNQVEFYSIYTSHHLNCVANNMLTVSHDVDYTLNIYELDENLKADSEQLQKDINQYGLISYEDSGCSDYEWYDSFNTKYCYIAIGKGLISYDYLVSLCEENGGNIDNCKEPSKKQLRRTVLLGSNNETITAKTYTNGLDSTYHLILGNNVTIKNNTQGENVTSNIYLGNDNGNCGKILVINGATNINAGVSMTSPDSFFDKLGEKDGNTTSITDKDAYSRFFTSDVETYGVLRKQEGEEGNYTYYYSLAQYCLTYDANTTDEFSGELEDTVSFAAENEKIASVTDKTLCRDGYKFLGWNTDKDATSALYSAGDTITFNNDSIILYAIWEELYTVTYDDNVDEDTVTNMPTDTTEYEDGATVTLSTATPQRDGYRFVGWSKDSTATTADEFTDNQLEIYEDTVLYAVWTEKLHYTCNENSGWDGEPETSYNAGDKITITSNTVVSGFLVLNDKRLYHTQVGKWTKEYTIINDGATMVLENNGSYGRALITDGYTITYVDNVKDEEIEVPTDENYYGSKEFISNGTTFIVGSTVTISSIVPTRDGYLFIGWNTKEDGTGTSYNAGDTFTIGTSDVTLYAIWESLAYDEDITISITDLAIGLEEDDIEITITSANASDLKLKDYALYLVGNDNEPATYVSKITSTGSYDLVFSLEGNNKNYYFVNEIISDGKEYKGTVAIENTTYLYSAGCHTYNLASASASVDGDAYTHIYLFVCASFELTGYTLTYDDNTEDEEIAVPTDSNIYSEGDSITLSSTVPSRNGYEFIGWNTDSNATTALTNLTMGDSDITLYAIWESLAYDEDVSISVTDLVYGLEEKDIEITITSANASDLKVKNYALLYMNETTHTLDHVTKITYPGTYNVLIVLEGNNKNYYFVNEMISDVKEYKGTVTIDTITDLYSIGCESYDFSNASTTTVSEPYTYIYLFVCTFYDLTGITLTYDDNAEEEEITVPTDSNVYENGDSTTISSTIPSRTGYEFMGWATDKDATTASYTVGDTITFGDNPITLYAIWKAIPHTCHDITFDKVLNSSFTGGALTTGNYYLAEDITLSSDITIEDGETVTLCLNDCVLNLNKNHIINNGILNLYECGEKERYFAFEYKDYDYSIAMVDEDAENKIAIKGGVITGAPIYAIENNNTFNMYGGNISGNGCRNGFGAAIKAQGVGVVTNLMNGKIIANITSYGAIFAESCTINMYDDFEIAYTYSTSCGGAIYLQAREDDNGNYVLATLNMYGGLIDHNIAREGGGVHCVEGTFNMYGGAITNNTARFGGGVCNEYAQKCFNMFGGAITNNNGGGVYNTTGVVRISGDAIIKDNTLTIDNGEEEVDIDFNLYTEVAITIFEGESNGTIYTGLINGADIHITLSSRYEANITYPFTVTNETSKDYSSFFTSDNPDLVIYNEGANSNQCVKAYYIIVEEDISESNDYEFKVKASSTNQENVSYQWYKGTLMTISEAVIGSDYNLARGSLNEEKIASQEISEKYIISVICKKEGFVPSYAIFDSSDDFEIEYGSIISHVGNHYVVALTYAFLAMNSDETFEISNLKFLSSTPIEGETSNKITNVTEKTFYFCLASLIIYNDYEETEEVVMSDIVSSYEITIDGNGALSGENPENIYDLPGREITLPENPYQRAGYNFLGWATSSDAKEALDTLTMTNEDISLYALWEEIPHTCHDITFDKVLNSSFTGGALTTGNYYLAEDMTLTSKITIAAGEIVNLCLNDCILNLNENSIENYGTFNLYDCGESERYFEYVEYEEYEYHFELVGTQSEYTISVYGGLITGAYQSAIYNYNTLNIYGGNISGNGTYYNDGAAIYNESQMSADAITVYATANLINGKIIANITERGSVFVNSATVNMYDDFEIGYNDANREGGAVYLNSEYVGEELILGTFNLYGGLIDYNNCRYYGGGVNSTRGCFNMYGGSITNNTAKMGGGVCNGGGANCFHMFGGSITNNDGCGVYNADGVVTITGSSVIKDNFISSNNSLACNLYTEVAITIFVGESNGTVYSGLVDGADIHIILSGRNGRSLSYPVALTNKTSQDYSCYFTSDNTDLFIYNSGSGDNQQVMVSYIALEEDPSMDNDYKMTVTTTEANQENVEYQWFTVTSKTSSELTIGDSGDIYLYDGTFTSDTTLQSSEYGYIHFKDNTPDLIEFDCEKEFSVNVGMIVRRNGNHYVIMVTEDSIELKSEEQFEITNVQFLFINEIEGETTNQLSRVTEKENYICVARLTCENDYETYEVNQYVMSCVIHSYEITFDANGATSGETPETIYELPGREITLPTEISLFKDEYYLLGWNTDSEATTALTNPTMGSSDTTLYAIWQENKYAITYDANTIDEVENLPVDENSYKGDTLVTITSSIPTRNGYKFIGWSMTKGANTPDEFTDNQVTMINGGLTLYAVWESLAYDEDISISVTDLVYGLEEKDIEITITSANASDLKVKDYMLFFLDMTKGTYSHETKITLPGMYIVLFILEGNNENYYFVNEYISGETSYKGTISVEHSDMLSTMGCDSYVLEEGYAIEGIHDYTQLYLYVCSFYNLTGNTITYDANTTDNVTNLPVDENEYLEGASITLSSTVPTRSGYTFAGWSMTKGAKTPDEFIDNQVTMINGGLTLYAVWYHTCHDIIFDKIFNSNAIDFETQSIPSGNYYLEEDIYIDALNGFTGNTIIIDTDAVVHICLNGHKLVFNTESLGFEILGKLHIYDCENTTQEWAVNNKDGKWYEETVNPTETTTGGCITGHRVLVLTTPLFRVSSGEFGLHDVDIIGAKTNGVSLIEACNPSDDVTITLDHVNMMGNYIIGATNALIDIRSYEEHEVTLNMSDVTMTKNSTKRVVSLFGTQINTSIGDNVIIKNNVASFGEEESTGLVFYAQIDFDGIAPLTVKENVQGTAIDVTILVDSSIYLDHDAAITSKNATDLSSIFTFATYDYLGKATSENNHYAIRNVVNSDKTNTTYLSRWYTVSYQYQDFYSYKFVGTVTDETHYFFGDKLTLKDSSLFKVNNYNSSLEKWVEASFTNYGWSTYKADIYYNGSEEIYANNSEITYEFVNYNNMGVDITLYPVAASNTLYFNTLDGLFYYQSVNSSLIATILDGKYTATKDEDGYYSTITFDSIDYQVENVRAIVIDDTSVDLFTINFKGINYINASGCTAFEVTNEAKIVLNVEDTLNIQGEIRLDGNATLTHGTINVTMKDAVSNSYHALNAATITIKDDAIINLINLDNDTDTFRVEGFDNILVYAKENEEDDYVLYDDFMIFEEDYILSERETDEGDIFYYYIQLMAYSVIEPVLENEYTVTPNVKSNIQWYEEKTTISPLVVDFDEGTINYLYNISGIKSFTADPLSFTIDDEFLLLFMVKPGFNFDAITFKSKTNIDYSLDDDLNDLYQEFYQMYGLELMDKQYDETLEEYTYTVNVQYVDEAGLNVAVFIASEDTTVYDINMISSYTAIPEANDTTFAPTESGKYLVQTNASYGYYASSTLIASSIKFDLCLDDASINDIARFSGLTATLPTNTFTKKGYNYLGWTTVPGGTTPEYQDGDLFTFGDDDVTLYAVWEEKEDVSLTLDTQEKTYTSEAITFDLIGNVTSDIKIEYLVDGSYTTVAPINAGIYSVRLTRLEDDTYKEYSETIENALVINHYVVNEDDITLVTDDFTFNGKDQLASLTASYMNAKGETISLVLDTCIPSNVNKATNSFKYASEYWVRFELSEIDKANYRLVYDDSEGIYYESYYTMKHYQVEVTLDQTTFIYNGEDQEEGLKASYIDVFGEEVSLQLDYFYPKYMNKMCFEEVGDYIAHFIFVDEMEEYEYIIGEDFYYEADVEIVPNVVKRTDVTFAKNDFTYNGESQTSLLTATFNNVYGEESSFIIKDITLAGETGTVDFMNSYANATYLVSFGLNEEDSANYALEDDVLVYTQEYTIKQKEIVIDWCSDNYTYNGEEKTISASYQDIASQTISLNITIKQANQEVAFKNAGSYVAVASFANQETDYSLPSEITKTYTINKAVATIDASQVVTDYTYTGSEQVVNSGATLNHSETELVYTNNSFTKVGTGSYTITISASETANYLATSTDIVITVNKAEAIIDASQVVTNYTYTGRKQTINSGATLNHSETELVYTNNSFTKVGSGSYTMTISAIETANYLAASTDVLISVAKAQAIIDTTNLITEYTYNGQEQVVDSGAKLNHGETKLVYSNNKFTNVGSGSYTITISAKETADYLEVSKDVIITVAKAQTIIDTTNVITEYTYNGQEQVVDSGATLNHTETSLVYSNNKFTNVGSGTYTITISAIETDNYKEATEEVIITVLKADYDMTSVKWDYTDAFTYDSEEKKVTVIGLPEGVSVSQYTDNTKTNAGSYIAKAILSYDAKNYNEVSIDNLSWTIDKGNYDMTSVKWDYEKAFTYDATSKTVTVIGLPEGVSVSKYTDNTKTNAGSYTAKAVLSYDTKNYNAVSIDNLSWTIDKAVATIDTSKVVTDYTYTGKEQTVKSGATLNHAETTLVYSNNKFTTVGTGSYTITISAKETANYQAVSQYVMITVNKANATIDTSKVVTNYTYNALEQVINSGAKLNHNETTLVYSNNTFTEVGTGSYTVTISAKETANYQAASEDVVITVAKAETIINTSKVVTSYTYNANEQVVDSGATMNHTETTLVYSNNTFTEVGSGSYTVIISAEETANYQAATKEVVIKVNKAEATIDTSNVITSYTYNANEQVVDSGATLNHTETELVYSNNKFTEVGKYTITISAEETANYKKASKQVIIKVNKAASSIDTSSVVTDYTYNGSTQVVDSGAKLNHDETTLVYSNNQFMSVGNGTYTVRISAKETANYLAASTVVVIHVAKATYDMSQAKWDYSNAFTYDASSKTVKVTGLPKGVTVRSYSNNIKKNAGTYIAQAILSYDSANYNEVAIDDLTWTIQKAKASIDTSKVVTDYTYNGGEQVINRGATLNHQETTLVYSNNKFTDVGSGTYTVTISAIETTNYESVTKEVVIHVNKADYDMSQAKWTYASAFTYDDTLKAVLLTGLPEGVSVQSYTDNEATNAGSYIAKAQLSYDSANYNDVTIKNCEWKINLLQVNEPTVMGEYKYDGSSQTVALDGLESYMTTTDSFTQTEIGTYTILFTLDDNHAWAKQSDGIITWEIKASSIASKDEDTPITEEPDQEEVIVTTEEGFTSDITVTVEVTVEVDVETKTLMVNYYDIPVEEMKLDKNEVVGVVFDVKLIQTINGVSREIQPSDIKEGTIIKVRMLIPEDVDISKVTRILHVHSETDIEEIEFDPNKVVDGYYEIEIDRLSEFAFIYKENNITHWLLLDLLIALIFSDVLLWFYFGIRNFVTKINDKRKVHVGPIAILGVHLACLITLMFFMCCKWCIILSIANIVLLLASILLFIFHKQKEEPALEKTEEVMTIHKIEQQPKQAVEPVQEVEEKEEPKLVLTEVKPVITPAKEMTSDNTVKSIDKVNTTKRFKNRKRH